MRQLTRWITICGALLAVSGAAYGDDFVFIAHLRGTQEVAAAPGELTPAPQPGIETATRGQFRIAFDHGLTKARFRLVVGNGVAITQAHLHCAPAGVNGPVTVFLFPLAPPPSPGVDANGLLSEGELTNASFLPGVDCTGTCAKPVNNLSSLRAAILDGCIYANVHTVANAGGEVRGQVRPESAQ